MIHPFIDTVESMSPVCVLREAYTPGAWVSGFPVCFRQPLFSIETLRKLLTVTAKPLSLSSINRTSTIKIYLLRLLWKLTEPIQVKSWD